MKEAKREKRNIFDEIRQGIAEMKDHREGKLTLKTTKIPIPARPSIDPERIREIRDQLKLSRSVFARLLLIKERTLESWEQGRAKPNAQAVALILLASQYPDTPERLRRVQDELAM